MPSAEQVQAPSRVLPCTGVSRLANLGDAKVMAKGSQLSQLKTALSQAGVTGQHHGKKRKHPGPTKDNVAKAAKLREIEQQLNPFDVKVTKLKHDVGGRKLRGIAGRPAQSKQAGIEQRKKTLLKEYEAKGHAGGIIDRRFGENDPTMTLEERMLERFTKERQRTSRGAAFNLDDEDELTHYGQSISKLDDFDNVGLNINESDDEDPGHIDGGIVANSHFGGFEVEEKDTGDDEPPRKKSKAEVMAEVMAKSKEHKLKRQMERERTDNIRHQLDEEFDSIRDLLLAQEASTADENPIGLPIASTSTLPHDSDYDTRVRELAFDQRAKAKDRTKTEEEIALEQKEALEKAELQRRKRMLGLTDSDSEGEDGKLRGKRKRGGDDLEGGFYDGDDALNALGSGLLSRTGLDDKHSEPGFGGDDAADSAEDGDSDEAEGSDEDDDALSGDSSESDSEQGEHQDLVPGSKHKAKLRKPGGELPFTFPCPSNHDEFLDIVDGLQDEDIPTVVQRILTLHHPSLAADNKYKLQTLSTVLIDYIIFIASPPSPRFGLLSSLLPHLMGLLQKYPTRSAEHFVAKLRLMHQNLRHGLSIGALNPDAKTWPSLPELTFMRLIGTFWPTSDMHHIVVSPARILMGAYLGLARVRCLSDLASGLFLCSLFLEYEQLSKRFVPEAVNFAIAAVLHVAPHQYKDASDLPGGIYAPDLRSDLCLPLAISGKAAKSTVRQKPKLMKYLSENSSDEQSKVDLLNVALDLLRCFAELYKGLDAFIELYEPICEVFDKISFKSLPGSVKDTFTSVQSSTARLLKFARQARKPLFLQAHKPIPIATYIPKFEVTSSSYLRHQDPNHERNEANKLRHQLKKERKGAIRELRKDAKFLAAVEQEKQKEKDRVYNERMKRVFGSIEGERAEQKAMERDKARDKKRAGRK